MARCSLLVVAFTGLTLHGCATDPETPEAIRAEACSDVCVQHGKLPCKGRDLDVLNPLSFVVEFAVGSCEAQCNSRLEPAACQRAHDALILCAATQGMACGGGTDEPATVDGCDEEAVQVGEACGSCVAMPSTDPNGCDSSQPRFYSCSRSSTQFMGYGSPFCYENCAEHGAGTNQFCCVDGYGSMACKADGGPICEGCQ
jgi:hypothetical protein